MTEKPDIAERIGRALVSSDLEPEDDYIVDIDKVTVLGMAGTRYRIGALFVRLHAGQDLHALAPLVADLASTIRGGLPMRWRRAVAAQAVLEVISPGCPACMGRGELRAGNGVVHICPRCEGTQVTRFTDASRAAGIGVGLDGYRRTFAVPLEAAMQVLRESIFLARRQAKRRLGNRPQDVAQSS